MRVSSLCVLADPSEVAQRLKGAAVGQASAARSCLVVGAGLRRYELFGTCGSERADPCDVQTLNDVNQAGQRPAQSLDIMKLDSSRRDSTAGEDGDPDRPPPEYGSAPPSDSGGMSGGAATLAQQIFVPYLLVYDLNVLVQRPATSNRIVAKGGGHGPYKKSTVKVGSFNQTNNISHSKTKLWSDPPLLLHNDIEMFFSPPNMFVKNKGTTQAGPASLAKCKAKESQTMPEPPTKTELKKEPKCIQCLPLPHRLDSLKLRLSVLQLAPTPCGEYLVVCLGRSDGPEGMVSGGVAGAVMVYRVCSGGEVVVLQEEPVTTKLLTSWELVPLKLLLLPPEVRLFSVLSLTWFGYSPYQEFLSNFQQIPFHCVCMSSQNFFFESLCKQSFQHVQICHLLWCACYHYDTLFCFYLVHS